MEKLQAYAGTDSDSSSEDETDSNRVMVLGNNHSELQTNFFGLESHTPKVIGHSLNKKEPVCESDNEKPKTDIPDGDFWKGFTPDMTNQELQHELQDIKSEANFTQREHGCHLNKFYNRRKRLHIKEDPVKRYEKKMYFLPEDSNCSPSDDIPSKSIAMEQEKCKIFYVHSKVAPYLTSNCSCKCVSKSVASWQSHDKAVNRLMWNRSNFSHLLLTAGMDSVVKIWNVWSSLSRCVSVINHHSKAVRNAIWGHQGRDIISCGYDKTAVVTDVESGAIKSRYVHPDFVTACTVHPYNPNCFVTGSDNLIQFWDQRTPISPIKSLTYKDKMGQPQDLLFIQNGSELISCNDIVSKDSADRTIMAWDIKSGNVISNQIYQERYTCTRLKYGSSNSHFLAQTQGGYVALFSTNRPYKMDRNKRFEGHKIQGYNIGFDVSHDGSLLYSGSAEDGVHCYDYRSGRLIRRYGQNNFVITDVACHPVLSTLIAACTWGGSVTLWQ